MVAHGGGAHHLRDDLQRALLEIVRRYQSHLEPSVTIAVLAVENTGRHVRAYIGSSDFFADRRFGQNDMVTAVRSPGSALKPFIYAMAFDELAAHPETMMPDVALRFGDYMPKNFDGHFRGQVSAREALESARKSGQWGTRKQWGEQKGATTEAKKAVERAQRDAVKVAVPDAKPLLQREGQALTAADVLDRMAQRASNRDPLSLPAAVIAQGRPMLSVRLTADTIPLRAGGPDTPVWSLTEFGGRFKQGDVVAHLKYTRGDIAEISLANELPVPAVLNWPSINGAAGALTGRPPTAPGGKDIFQIPLRHAGTYLCDVKLLVDSQARPSRARSSRSTLLKLVKPPPATRSPFESVVSANTEPFVPEPNADQLVPSQRAMQLGLTPDGDQKAPPATRSPFGSVVSAYTARFVPEPSADHLMPSHRAMLEGLTPPAT